MTLCYLSRVGSISVNAVLILGVFVLFAALMMARRLPALLAIPAMALAMAAVAGVPPRDLAVVIEQGAVRLSSAYMAVFFGAVLGRILMETGVAEEMVKQAAEFAGDSPMLVLAVVSVVTAVLFTGLSGLGAIIMVGTIVFPILLSLGIPREFAATMFLMAYGVGFVLNINLWQFYRDVLNLPTTDIYPFAVRLMLVNAAVATVFFFLGLRRYARYAFWAVADRAALKPARNVSPLAFLTPLVPLVLHGYFHWPVSPAFLGGVLFAVVVVRPPAVARLISRSALKGLEDAAPSILLMVGIGMLLKAADLPAVREVLASLLGRVHFPSALSYVLFFTLLSPLVLYRGPMNPWGAGIGIYAAFYALKLLPGQALLAALMCVAQVQAVSEPTNTHNVWVGSYLGVGVTTIARKTLPWMVLVAFGGLLIAAARYF